MDSVGDLGHKALNGNGHVVVEDRPGQVMHELNHVITIMMQLMQSNHWSHYSRRSVVSATFSQ